MSLVVRLSLEALMGAGCATSGTGTLVEQESVYAPLEMANVFGRNDVAVSTSTPFDIPTLPVARIKLLFLETTVPMVAVLTSAAGATQRVPFGGPLVLVTVASPLTAVRVEGDGLLQFLVGGDPS